MKQRRQFSTDALEILSEVQTRNNKQLNKKKRLKVVYEENFSPYDEISTNALLTQLMVTITRVGLRVDRFGENDAIIGMETKHDD